MADFPGILSRCELDLAAAVLLADLERGARRLRSARLRAVRLEKQGRPFLQAVAAKAVERGDRPPIEQLDRGEIDRVAHHRRDRIGGAPLALEAHRELPASRRDAAQTKRDLGD